MDKGKFRLAMAGLCAAVLALSGGCPLVTDAFNPDFLASFGIPSSSSSGTVLVAFTNTTQFDAQFFAQPFDSLSDTSQVTAGGLITATVLAGQNRTFAVDCPVGAIVPGDGAGAGGVSTTSVIIAGATDTNGAAAVLTLAFTGAPLQSGDDFVCGDVIEMRLLQVGTGAAVTDFVLQVRVLPGR